MVEVGLGLGFLPDMVTAHEVTCEGRPTNGLSRIQVGPPMTRRIVLASWKNAEICPSVEAFIDELRLHRTRYKSCSEPSLS